MRTLGMLAVIGLILGLLFGGLPDSADHALAGRIATFTITRGGVEVRTVEPADAWDVQPDGQMLIRTPPGGGPTEYYATASDDRADASVMFSDADAGTDSEPHGDVAPRNGNSVTMYLVKLDTTAP